MCCKNHCVFAIFKYAIYIYTGCRSSSTELYKCCAAKNDTNLENRRISKEHVFELCDFIDGGMNLEGSTGKVKTSRPLKHHWRAVFVKCMPYKLENWCTTPGYCSVSSLKSTCQAKNSFSERFMLNKPWIRRFRKKKKKKQTTAIWHL